MIFALHGNLGSAEDFAFLQPDVAVASSRRLGIQPIDLWPLSHLSLKEVAAELKRRAELCQCHKLLGYSMGGRIALQALADDPDFWTHAVIISAHPGLKSEPERAQRRASDQEWAHLARTAPWSDFLAKWNAQSVFTSDHQPSTINHQRLASRRENVARAFENWSLGQQEDLRPHLETYPGKVTWVVGQNDLKFLALAVEMRVLIPHCELVAVPNCGHRVLLEHPKVVHDLVWGAFGMGGT